MNAIAEVTKVKERHREELLRLPNVTSVGVGAKVVAGEPKRVIAIKVYVAAKVPREQLTEAECVPKEVEGIPTDVEQLAPPKAYRSR